MSCREDRIELMRDVCLERHGTLALHEAIDGLHKGQFIVWDGDKCIAVGSREWARRHLPGGDKFSAKADLRESPTGGTR